MASKNQLRAHTGQKITLSLTKDTLQKVRVLAARRATSISRLVEDQIESLIEQEERAQRQALALLDQGFHLGGVIQTLRDEWHDR
jgi:hypothetical protein